MDKTLRRIDIEAEINGEETNVSIYAHKIVSIEWSKPAVICCAGGHRYQVTDEFARAAQDELENPVL